ncbi:hypothetical protein TNCV_2787431 [Trichonephila clavipes]|uniref:Uncharacterized protein n=1 Tax=Trichonephila clavipes TaxID=2585209 RepID=A0A8X6SWE7_TRICX|nr:hypothetical protein TNCV_2787431 [Trichonephila clavipes]
MTGLELATNSPDFHTTSTAAVRNRSESYITGGNFSVRSEQADRLRPPPCAFHNEQRQVAKQYFKSQASSQTHANETHTYPSVPRRTVASGLNERLVRIKTSGTLKLSFATGRLQGTRQNKVETWQPTIFETSCDEDTLGRKPSQSRRVASGISESSILSYQWTLIAQKVTTK